MHVFPSNTTATTDVLQTKNKMLLNYCCSIVLLSNGHHSASSGLQMLCSKEI